MDSGGINQEQRGEPRAQQNRAFFIIHCVQPQAPVLEGDQSQDLQHQRQQFQQPQNQHQQPQFQRDQFQQPQNQHQQPQFQRDKFQQPQNQHQQPQFQRDQFQQPQNQHQHPQHQRQQFQQPYNQHQYPQYQGDQFQQPQHQRDQFQDQHHRHQLQDPHKQQFQDPRNQMPHFQGPRDLRDPFQDQFQRLQLQDPHNYNQQFQAPQDVRDQFQDPRYMRDQFRDPPTNPGWPPAPQYQLGSPPTMGDAKGTEPDSHHVPGKQDLPKPGPGGKQQLSLVLLGRRQVGKTSSAKNIMGYRTYNKDAEHYFDEAAVCRKKTMSVNGTTVNVIDTPDFSTIAAPTKQFKVCKDMCEGSLCVYFLVCKIQVATSDLYSQILEYERGLGTRVRDRVIILFTHGETLRAQQADDFLNPDIKEFISKCANKYQVLNNKDYTRILQQIRELKQKLAALVLETYDVKVFTKQGGKMEKSGCSIA